jgi:hypothetical protein
MLLILRPPAPGADKLKPEELIARHLASIGQADAVTARSSFAAEGTGKLIIMRQGNVQERALDGQAIFLSHGSKLRCSLRFQAPDYPSEEVAFDGDKTYVGYVQPGKRTRIGEFLHNHESILKEGLFGGALSTAWPLLDVKEKKPRLKSKGLKDVSGQKLHELEYKMRKGGSDLEISLFFDEAFHHVATTYRFEIPPLMTTVITDSAKQVSTHVILEERFGDFRLVNGLTLPFRWKATLITQGQGGRVLSSAAQREFSLVEWNMVFRGFEPNAEIGAEFFVLP